MSRPILQPPPGPLPTDFPSRWASAWGEDRASLWQAFTYRGVQQAFRWIPPGRFIMGSPLDEHDRDVDEQQHEVILTRGCWLAETACTQALWQAVMGENHSFYEDDLWPAETVSWNDVQDFISRLNARKPELSARLPTEAEWEYACRAGTGTPFSFGDDISPEQVNYNGEFPYRKQEKGLTRQKPVNVKSLPPNPWGFYEMHGNIWEWCQDWYGTYPEGSAIDPLGPESGTDRVLRGGSWIRDAYAVRSACRSRRPSAARDEFVGFRLALGSELQPEQPARGPEG